MHKKQQDKQFVSFLSRRNFLRDSKIATIALKLPAKLILAVFVFFVAIYFILALVPISELNAQTTQRAAERAALQAELAALEAQINEYEKTVQGYRQRGATLTQEVRRLNTRISSMNLQIRTLTLNLRELDEEIGATTERVQTTETNIENTQAKIGAALRKIEEGEDKNLVEILLENPSLSDFFGNINNILIVQNALSEDLRELQGLRADYVAQKEELVEQKESAEMLKNNQEAQRRATESLRRERDNVLRVTRGREAEYQRLLTQTRKTVAEIRARLFHLADGGRMTFAQAYEHARVASGVTGIRPEFLLAILDRESGLGRNVGQCSYRTAMHPTRDIPAFRGIIAELGLQEELAAGRIRVSCPIPRDGAWGGAMGPSQFIPSTWVRYRDRVAEITGVRPANPWNNRDAFIATALLIRDNFNSTACRNHAGNNQALRERCAAAMYYAGGAWHRFMNSYGRGVMNRAADFADDLVMLRGNQAQR